MDSCFLLHCCCIQRFDSGNNKKWWKITSVINISFRFRFMFFLFIIIIYEWLNDESLTLIGPFCLSNNHHNECVSLVQLLMIIFINRFSNSFWQTNRSIRNSIGNFLYTWKLENFFGNVFFSLEFQTTTIWRFRYESIDTNWNEKNWMFFSSRLIFHDLNPIESFLLSLYHSSAVIEFHEISTFCFDSIQKKFLSVI